jgi:hypothetical protein
MVILAALLVTGCTPDGGPDPSVGQQVQFVAGGGDDDGGAASDAFIDGALLDFVVDGAGTIRALTDDRGLTLWTVRDGALSRTPVKLQVPTRSSVVQLAAGPDGTVWLGARHPHAVYRVESDGTVSRTLGEAAGKGRTLPPDGTPVDAGPIRSLSGLAVSPGGAVAYADVAGEPVLHQRVRSVHDGRLGTVLGRDLTGLKPRQYRQDPVLPAGTRATDMVLTQPSETRLAYGADGTLYAAPGGDSIVAVGPDGTARRLAGGPAADLANPAAARAPFQARGPAAQATVAVESSARRTANPSLVADARGDVYLTNRRTERALPATYSWAGVFTPAQNDLLTAMRDGEELNGIAPEVLRIAADGTLSTVAVADAAGVHGDWLYLARSLIDPDGAKRVVVVRTAIPR